MRVPLKSAGGELCGSINQYNLLENYVATCVRSVKGLHAV